MEFSTDSYPEDSYQPANQCEICGAELTDEVVIQEFADGSIARLCAECAAGAALPPGTDEFRFPDDIPPAGGDLDSAEEVTSIEEPAPVEADVSTPSAAEAAPAPTDVSTPSAAAAAPAPAAGPQAVPGYRDPLEQTRELLTPVVDLLGLQREMQGALQRLATSLQTFATDVITEKSDKDATVESRLDALERELELTRARLRETEARLAATAVGAGAPAGAEAAATAAGAAAAVRPTAGAPSSQTEPTGQSAGAAHPADALWSFDSTGEATAESTLANAGEPAEPEPVQGQPDRQDVDALPESDTATQPYSLEDLASTLPPLPPKLVPPPVAPPAGPATAEHHDQPVFLLPEVQIAQRYFNESQFTNRVRDVRKSLGKPKANLTKLVGAEPPRAIITVFWDIIWYQYLVDLRRDIPSDQRVTLHREGMDLGELTPLFKEKNASVDDTGRLDASELEVKLLSDPSTLISEMSVEDERALEDATEEIWDQKTAPEFRWDD